MLIDKVQFSMQSAMRQLELLWLHWLLFFLCSVYPDTTVLLGFLFELLKSVNPPQLLNCSPIKSQYKQCHDSRKAPFQFFRSVTQPGGCMWHELKLGRTRNWLWDVWDFSVSLKLTEHVCIFYSSQNGLFALFPPSLSSASSSSMAFFPLYLHVVLPFETKGGASTNGIPHLGVH